MSRELNIPPRPHAKGYVSYQLHSLFEDLRDIKAAHVARGISYDDYDKSEKARKFKKELSELIQEEKTKN